MIDFLTTYHLQGLVLGLCSFLIIGICHPIVIKGEYHYGQRFKWFFLVAGVLLCIGSLLVSSVMLSALMGVGAFSCFWGIKEMKDQQERVRKVARRVDERMAVRHIVLSECGVAQMPEEDTFG